MTNTLHRANARSRRVPPVIFRGLLALIISALVLAIGVPALVRQGIEVRGWMLWSVILACLALAVGPDLVARLRSRTRG